MTKPTEPRTRHKSGLYADLPSQAVLLKVPVRTHKIIKKLAWDLEISAHDLMVQAIIDMAEGNGR